MRHHCDTAQLLRRCAVFHSILCAEDKEAHRQEKLEGKALNINPTLKHLVRHRFASDKTCAALRKREAGAFAKRSL